MTAQLLTLNPGIDRATLAARFKSEGRVQVPDALVPESAEAVRQLLFENTPWELAWQAGNSGGPQTIDNAALRSPDAGRLAGQASEATDRSAHAGEYTCRFANYPVLKAYLDQRNPGGPYDLLLEQLNMPEMLDLVREITGVPELIKADAQATLFSGNHFLGYHDDSNKGQGWRIAYVMGFAPDDWRPDWGGYLQFFDENDDIEFGWKPRFNVLNLMAVPCPHAVSYVPPFAPNGRVSITGWFRDR